MRTPATPLRYDAVLFDPDGVLATARARHAAWRSASDAVRSGPLVTPTITAVSADSPQPSRR